MLTNAELLALACGMRSDASAETAEEPDGDDYAESDDIEGAEAKDPGTSSERAWEMSSAFDMSKMTDAHRDAAAAHRAAAELQPAGPRAEMHKQMAEEHEGIANKMQAHFGDCSMY